MFDPEGRAGPFEKAVHVVAEGAEPGALTLRITGTVVPAFVADGVALGALTFDRARVEVVLEGGAAQASFRFVNAGRAAGPHRARRGVGAGAWTWCSPSGPCSPDQTGGLFVIAEGTAPAEVGLDVYTTDPDAPGQAP